jgi:hypothetical protein
VQEGKEEEAMHNASADAHANAKDGNERMWPINFRNLEKIK